MNRDRILDALRSRWITARSHAQWMEMADLVDHARDAAVYVNLLAELLEELQSNPEHSEPMALYSQSWRHSDRVDLIFCKAFAGAK